MAETTKSAAKAAKAPTKAQLESARAFALEPFLLEGEKLKDLVAGTPRREAFDAALAEIADGRESPSIEWRRQFSLLLGLERLLAEEPPKLVDGTELSEHQVDALSGTLAVLISDVQEEEMAPPVTADADKSQIPAPPVNGDSADDDEALDPDEEPQDWEEEATEEEAVAEVVDDPGAARRFWFEHATGAGKTVAAVGFVEASRTGGILILTHRRNLVDQFIGEISTRG